VKPTQNEAAARTLITARVNIRCSTGTSMPKIAQIFQFVFACLKRLSILFIIEHPIMLPPIKKNEVARLKLKTRGEHAFFSLNPGV
jgi:hypothetical protein